MQPTQSTLVDNVTTLPIKRLYYPLVISDDNVIRFWEP